MTTATTTARTVLFCILLLNAFSTSLFAQDSTGQKKQSPLTVALGADIQTSFWWRGVVLESRPVIQPGVTLSVGGFQAAFLATHTIGQSAFKSTLMALGYMVKTANAGAFSVQVVDYYYPTGPVPYNVPNFNADRAKNWLNYKGNGEGAHTLEANASYSGTESFPIGLFLAYNFYNDPDRAVYAEASYKVDVTLASLQFFLGAMLSRNSVFYSAPDSPLMTREGISNIGFTASRSLKVTDGYSIPFRVTFGVNPTSERAYVVFALSL